MGLFGILRGKDKQPSLHIAGHLAGRPQIVVQDGEKYIVFRLTEVEGTEFRLKMLPTTLVRWRGDHVEVIYTSAVNGTATVESVLRARQVMTSRWGGGGSHAAMIDHVTRQSSETDSVRRPSPGGSAR